VDSGRLLSFLAREGIGRVVIVSPHLDDAAFSTCALLLSTLAGDCHVATVFTEGSPTLDASWAREAGFADSVDEHAARRVEDRAAMSRLGVGFSHLGFMPDAFTPALAHAVVDAAAAAAGVPASGEGDPGVLWLLPAGAGRSRRVHEALRRCCQWLGRPAGARAHPEHRLVRDRLLAVLQERGCRFGFYGELPYVWLDPAPILSWTLGRACRGPFERVSVDVDPRVKLQVCEMYASQAPLVLGDTLEERLRVLAHAEAYYFPAPLRRATR
jgi:LmbE family N-acetylglucosaminyl deacetylase